MRAFSPDARRVEPARDSLGIAGGNHPVALRPRPGCDRSRGEAGFTLVELMIASTLSALVVFGAFIALTGVQVASATQNRTVDLVSQGRIALELIGKDVRGAGDSVNDLPAPCLGTAADPESEWGCPAVLEPHPWRVVLARNAWAPGADGILGTTDDVPDAATAFDQKPANVVAYEFQPKTELTTFADGRKGYIGRVVRIENPLRFPGGKGTATTTVLLENVLLDDRMTVDPAAPDTADPRTAHALFLYGVLSNEPNEFAGDETFVDRATRTGSFLLPPVRFFAIPDEALPALSTTPPFRPTHDFEIVGLKADGTAQTSLQSLVTNEESLSFILARNRIRTVRVAFKVVGAEDDPSFTGGLDLDADAPGTAPLYPFESTFELKVFAPVLRDR
jgi:prepilin-type N-terminal cleavage/methylation domain-containing protein